MKKVWHYLSIEGYTLWIRHDRYSYGLYLEKDKFGDLQYQASVVGRYTTEELFDLFEDNLESRNFYYELSQVDIANQDRYDFIFDE